MLDSIVKFVDSNNYFVASEGPLVNLYTVAASASSATIETIVKEDIDAGDYLIIPTPTTTYYAWMDTSGSATTDDPDPTGFDTDAGIRVAISGATTAASVATILAAAIDGVTGLTAAVNSYGDVEVDVDAAGECDPISDFSCGFTLTQVLGGADANGLIKAATPNSDARVVEVKDIEYVSSTDILTVLVKIKTKTLTDSSNPESGYTTVYSHITLTDTDFVLG